MQSSKQSDCSPLYMIQVYCGERLDLKRQIITANFIVCSPCTFSLGSLVSKCPWCHYSVVSSSQLLLCRGWECVRRSIFTFKGRGSSSWLNWCSNTTAASTFPDRGSFLTKSSKCSSVSNPRTEGKAQEEHDISKRFSSHKHLICMILLPLPSRYGK